MLFCVLFGSINKQKMDVIHLKKLRLWFSLVLLISTTDAEYLHGKILHKKSQTLINKVTLTQKGYIQFLRYIADIPTIHDFTFCIWMKSYNLTHSHPLLSYSMHEEERLIRAWISPLGKTANLAIREHLVFKIPVNLREHHWYHICQSWETKSGYWAFYMNGKLKASGQDVKLRGVKIPPRGDLVVGQEYTDFDKGLDDGIEGDIYGFNFVLSPAIPSPDYAYSEREALLPRSNYNNQNVNIYSTTETGTTEIAHFRGGAFFSTEDETQVPPALGYFSSMTANREPKGMYFGGFYKPPKTFHPHYPPPLSYSNFVAHRRSNPSRPSSTRRIYNSNKLYSNDISGQGAKTLGLVLVELGYQNCAFGRGAPVDGDKVLVSWTKTPVRVFGGAILKSVPPFCI